MRIKEATLIVDEGETPRPTPKNPGLSYEVKMWPVYAVAPGYLPELIAWVKVGLKRGRLYFDGERTIAAALAKLKESEVGNRYCCRAATPATLEAIAGVLRAA
jgi:hypothetical protein